MKILRESTQNQPRNTLQQTLAVAAAACISRLRLPHALLLPSLFTVAVTIRTSWAFPISSLNQSNDSILSDNDVVQQWHGIIDPKIIY